MVIASDGLRPERLRIFREGLSPLIAVLRVSEAGLDALKKLIGHFPECQNAVGGSPRALALCDWVAARPHMLAGCGCDHAGFGERHLTHGAEPHVSLLSVPYESEDPFSGAIGGDDEI